MRLGINPEVEKMAKEKGIRLIPSNYFFSKACELLLDEVSKSEWIETLLSIIPDVSGKKAIPYAR